jgi:hypothetical protein
VNNALRISHRYPRNTLGGTGTWLVAHLPVSAAIAALGATMPALIAHAKDRRAPAAIGLAVARPAPLVLVIALNLTFAGPWTYAVIRRGILTPTSASQTQPAQ